MAKPCLIERATQMKKGKHEKKRKNPERSCTAFAHGANDINDPKKNMTTKKNERKIKPKPVPLHSLCPLSKKHK